MSIRGVALNDPEWLLLRRALAELVEREGETPTSDAATTILKNALTLAELKALKP